MKDQAHNLLFLIGCSILLAPRVWLPCCRCNNSIDYMDGKWVWGPHIAPQIASAESEAWSNSALTPEIEPLGDMQA